jgi:hypothetical protein
MPLCRCIRGPAAHVGGSSPAPMGRAGWLQAVGCGLRAAGCRLQAAGCWLRHLLATNPAHAGRQRQASSSAARRAPSAGHAQQPAGRCRLRPVGPWRHLSPYATWCAGQPAGTPAAATPAAAPAAAPPPAAASTTLADSKSGSSQVLVAGGGSGGLNGCGSSSLGYACFQQVGGASGPAAEAAQEHAAGCCSGLCQ